MFGYDFKLPYGEIINSRQFNNDSCDYKQEFINRMMQPNKIVKQELEKATLKREVKHKPSIKGGIYILKLGT